MKHERKEGQARNWRYATVEINGKKMRAFIFQNEEEMIRHKEIWSDIEADLKYRQSIKDYFTKAEGK